MLTVAGFGVLVPEILAQVDLPIASTLALLLGELWIVVDSMILSFATGGRLTSSVDVVIVQTFFFALFVMQFAVMLFLPDRRNLLLVWPDANVAEALTRIQFGVLAIAALAVAVVTVHRWRAASQPRRRRAVAEPRRQLVGRAVRRGYLTTLIAGSPSTLLMSLRTRPCSQSSGALLWGLLRSRLARASRTCSASSARCAARGWKRDSQRRSATQSSCWHIAFPDQQAFIDGAGRPVDLPGPDSDRTAAPIERGRELGMLVYDVARRRSGACRRRRRRRDRARRCAATGRVRRPAGRAARLARAPRRRRRRRTEAARRDLHDGAQQRLVSVALQLRMIERHIRTDPALNRRLDDVAGNELSQSLEELRELARGIHPAVLNHDAEGRAQGLSRRARVGDGLVRGRGAPARAGGARRVLRGL